jgi:hypothetical protein
MIDIGLVRDFPSKHTLFLAFQIAQQFDAIPIAWNCLPAGSQRSHQVQHCSKDLGILVAPKHLATIAHTALAVLHKHPVNVTSIETCLLLSVTVKRSCLLSQLGFSALSFSFRIPGGFLVTAATFQRPHCLGGYTRMAFDFLFASLNCVSRRVEIGC